MAYVSLYRKYRPQTFDEIVGQDHVTRSLTNAITEDKLHHAYLFAGPRGTGKTSTARILAKSINCAQGPTPAPCNACDQCVAITQGTSVDVIELDMASHGGVDDARELRDRARFSPASARRKVYILDEVHMASTAAFNALLKLIEEPPAHVLFAMATTDPQKVLPTIMSRVQRLDLRRVAAADVAGRVKDLVAREGGSIDDEAVDAIVRAGDGSLRDTESVLEQVLSYAEGGDVTGRDVIDVLGQTPFEATARVVTAMTAGNLAEAFAAVQELLDAGTDLRQFTRDLVGHVRDLLVLVVAPDRPDLVDATAERRQALQAQSESMSRAVLTTAIDELALALAEMRQGPARLALELAVARVAGSVTQADASGPAVTQDADPAADVEDADAEHEQVTAGDGDVEVTDAAGDQPDTLDTSATSDEPDEPTEGTEAEGAEDAQTGEQSGRTSLVKRATQRAAEVARDGMPEPKTKRPEGNTVEYDAPPDPDEAAQLDTVAANWAVVLERVRDHSARAEAMLTNATPVKVRHGILMLDFAGQHSFHAHQVANGQFDAVVQDALQRTTDLKLRLDVSIDGAVVERDHPKGEPAAAVESPAERAAARAANSPATSSPATPSRADDQARDDAHAGSSDAGDSLANPMAHLDPGEAMDRAANALQTRLGAVEVTPDT